MPTYDKHYTKPGYFGNPYPELVNYFESYEPKGKLLDLGCGQGRDTIALARMGYAVIGVDISEVGISQMMNVAKKEGLNIRGIVADIYNYYIDETIDVVLLDSMLHFYKPDKQNETDFLNRVINELRLDGLLCIVVWKSKKIEKELMNIFERSEIKWTTFFDKYIDYPNKNMEMRMIVKKKIN